MSKENNDKSGVTMGWMPARFYDALLCCFTLGRETQQRLEILDLASIQPGQVVLDVGCGTGTLAIMAVDHGATKVVGVDPSPSMIRRAKAKAGNNRPELEFQVGFCQSLPADDETFNVVLCTFTLHHIPGDESQEKCLNEMKRVLAPNGRLLIVDFAEGHHGHHRHHHHHHQDDTCNNQVVPLVEKAGFERISSQPVSMLGATAVLAHKPAAQP